MALYFSRDMLKVLKNTLFYDSIESLFQKVKSTLSADTLRFLNQIEKTLHVGITPHKNYGKIKEIIHTANDAVLNRRCLQITYYSMHRKKESRRVIAPYKLWFFDGTFYLLAHCRLRNDIRMFAADRIKEIDVLNSTFEIPPESDIESVLQASFGAFIGAAIPVVIHFSADVAEYIQEKIWHQSQSIEPQQDGSIIFRATVAGIEEIKHWVLGWGAGATVLAPEPLKKEIAAEAAALLQNYGQTG
jgi:predicted DNA-binding transcriptional regulator YafY